MSQPSGVVDPLDDAALLVEWNHGIGADVQLPAPRLGILTETLLAENTTVRRATSLPETVFIGQTDNLVDETVELHEAAVFS